jgi:hypothetical protein
MFPANRKPETPCENCWEVRFGKTAPPLSELIMR